MYKKGYVTFKMYCKSILVLRIDIISEVNAKVSANGEMHFKVALVEHNMVKFFLKTTGAQLDP